MLSMLSWSCLAQQSIPLQDLSAFDHPSSNWTIEGAVKAAYQDTSLQVAPGQGVLVNTLRNGKYKRSDDLTFQLNHGDIHLKLDFLIPKGANSGIYLQGRYEIQLYDSWGKKRVKYDDLGGIYERWDDSRGKGHEGYEGYAPMQNAAKAPGIWQQIDITFQAPRFDATGKKVQNAVFKEVILNGVLIHKNIEVSGMTRGALFDKEAAFGPLRIQGDHGPIAFRNVSVETFDKPSVQLSEITYHYYTGKFTEPVIGTAKAVETGKLPALTYKVIKAKNDYLIQYEAELTVPETDSYEFQSYWTGDGTLKIDGKILNEGAHWYSEKVSKQITLTAGKHNLELIHIKDFPWGPQALGLFVKRIGAHPVALHDRTSLLDPEAVGVIAMKADAEPVFQRSFAFHKGVKKTHVIHVGDPSGIHYSYDLKQGALLQVWKGPFLNATQMWDNRGEPQTAEPLGVTVVLDGKSPLVLDRTAQADSIPLVYKGFRLVNGRPVFSYFWPAANVTVEDWIMPNDAATGLKRTMKMSANSATQSAMEIVMGNTFHLASIKPGLIEMGGYYIQSEQEAAILPGNSGIKSVRIPVKGAQVSYQLIW